MKKTHVTLFMRRMLLASAAMFFASVLLFFAVKVFAQTTATGSTVLGTTISFPIAELGNCTSVSDCKAYCDDPTHTAACVAYAKAKGFYQPTTLDTDQNSVLTDAQATLGCDSVDSCRTFCQQSQNAAACTAFAQKHNLRGGQQNTSTTTLAKAEATFGCTSLTSCQAFCDQNTNKAECSAFAKENGLPGGNQTRGPGGCTSQATCKTFCANPNNFQICKDFVQQHISSTSGQHTFTGPGGCTSQESCQSYCEQNPTSCHIPARFVPQNPQGSSSAQNVLTPVPHTIQSYCQQFPYRCVTPTVTSASESPTPSSGIDYQKYCSEKGCLYNGTGCVCPSNTQQSTNGQQNHPIPQQSFPTIPNMQKVQEGPSVPPNLTHPAVQGASTHVDFFQWLVNKIFHL